MKTVAKSTDLKSGGIACGSSLQASDVGTDDGRVGIASSSSKGKRFLYLFSGPKDRTDSFGNYAKKLWIECDEYDIVNGKQYDLVCDAVWSSVLQDVKMGKYDGVLMAPRVTPTPMPGKPTMVDQNLSVALKHPNSTVYPASKRKTRRRSELQHF